MSKMILYFLMSQNSWETSKSNKTSPIILKQDQRSRAVPRFPIYHSVNQ